jgi:diacylglycerol kinase (ATP)
MRITLMHNPKAGRRKHSKKQLIRALAEAGHQVIYQSTKKKNDENALKKPTDLVLVAGGDGTVGKIAWRLIETGIPISILPLGTANNLAHSLGFTGSTSELIGGLKNGQRHAFDIGIARGPWGEHYIFEGIGAGLLADYLDSPNREKAKAKKKTSKEQEMTRHVTLLRQMLHDYPAKKWKIELDGKSISGRYILWEAMNIRSVGPALFLAPWAGTKDGEFDFVRVREKDRPLLLKHLDARIKGKKHRFPLPICKFRQLRISWKKSAIHLDDKIWPGKNDKVKDSVEIKITVKPSALLVLRPNGMK